MEDTNMYTATIWKTDEADINKEQTTVKSMF